MTTTTQSASLHYREGNSDKVYHAAIEPKADGYIVTFAYGRRGNTLNTGIKTTRPVTFEEAECVFDKLVRSKLAKGYHFTAMQAAATPYRQTGDEGRDTGIRCQLLNPVEADEVNRLITSRQYCLQLGLQRHPCPLQPGPPQLRRTPAQVQVRRKRVLHRHRHQPQAQRHPRPLRRRQTRLRRQRHHPTQPRNPRSRRSLRSPLPLRLQRKRQHIPARLSRPPHRHPRDRLHRRSAQV